MKFKESPYYDKKFLGKYLYQKISDNNVIFTIQEFFDIDDKQKEYFKEGFSKDNRYYSYKLVVYEDYYELNCERPDDYLFLVFDKTVYITGVYCSRVIAPEIVIKNKKNTATNMCVADKIIVNNDCEDDYNINNSKIHNIYFYNNRVSFFKSEINNFFIFNKNLYFYDNSLFIFYHKVKFIGFCDDLKDKMLNNMNFNQGIIHIE